MSDLRIAPRVPRPAAVHARVVHVRILGAYFNQY